MALPLINKFRLNGLDSSNIINNTKMKKDFTKTSLIVLLAFITGVIITVFSYQALTIYQIRAQVINDHATLLQVVDFLNQNIQAQQSQQATQKNVPQNASTDQVKK